jgi:hypothetical protein
LHDTERLGHDGLDALRVGGLLRVVEDADLAGRTSNSGR